VQVFSGKRREPHAASFPPLALDPSHLREAATLENDIRPISSISGTKNERKEPLMLPVLLGRLAGKLAFVAPGGFSLRPWLQRLRGVAIGRNVWISQLVYIDEIHPTDVTIGENCTIGLRTSIISHFYSGPRRPASNGKVVIEKDVFIGPHCVILPNVRIGEGAVIKAGTVVSRNVPPHTFWGCPSAESLGVATVPLTAEHQYDEFLRGLRLHTKSRINSHRQ
jgi:acetyltransferase-like isoleucine patch superfamily enzyme